MLKPAALLAPLALAACVTTTTPLQTTADRAFALPTGQQLTVSRYGNSAILSYPSSYPLTDAETVSYIEDATGCRAGALQSSNAAVAGPTLTETYALLCG